MDLYFVLRVIVLIIKKPCQGLQCQVVSAMRVILRPLVTLVVAGQSTFAANPRVHVADEAVSATGVLRISCTSRRAMSSRFLIGSKYRDIRCCKSLVSFQT